MKKNIKIVLLISTFVFVGLIFYGSIRLARHWDTDPGALCVQADGWWGPIGPNDDRLVDCNGNRLNNDSTFVIQGDTCYCHTDNTCWNGKDCVPIDINSGEATIYSNNLNEIPTAERQIFQELENE